MHELAITQAMTDAIIERAGAARVIRVRLQIGALSGVEPGAVRFCFDAMALGTALDGAALEIGRPAGDGLCRECGARFPVDDPLAVCACGSTAVEVTGGQQVRIQDIEMEVAADVRDMRL
jgi:hydrogenase nickel incorporation protein HypA/HybF